MLKKYTTALLFLCCFSLISYSQVTVSGALAGNGTYSYLSSAFTAINGAVQTGANITITITASPITEVSSAILNNGAWASVSIQPSGGSARVINSTYSPTIELNGADNVTINGLNSGGNSLTINNNNIGVSTAAIRFINDATNNLVTNCTLKANCQAQNVAGQGAVVWFYTTNATTGNDNNTLSYCDITSSGGTRPSQAIRSDGTANKANNNNTISNCNIYDFGTTVSATASIGINIADNSTAWTITNNKIYQPNTIAFSTGTTFQYRGVSVTTTNPSTAGGHTITGNTVGYSSSSGTGFTTITTGPNVAYGITYNITGASPTSSTISNNIIANIDQTSSRSPTGASDLGTQVFTGIYIKAGLATVSGNTIGSSSSTGSIIVRGQQVTASTTTCVAGIVNLGTANNTFSANTIGGFTLTNGAGATNYTEFFAGIRNENTGTTSITGNTIGNSAANNISSDQASANEVGILLSSSGGSVTASSNIITNIKHSGANTGTQSAASVIGILTSGSGGSYTLSQNQISALTNTNTGNVGVWGIVANQNTAGNTISRNLIYGLSVSANSPSGYVYGISTLQGTMTISNNMVSLGNGLSNNPSISGIDIENGTPNIYYNTSVITGNASGGSTSNTYALNFQFSSASGVQIQDNIFYNERVSSSSVKNMAVFFNGALVPSLGNVTTMNYNDLYVSSSNTVLAAVFLTTYGTLAAWQAAYSKDLNSQNTSMTFNNIANDLHISPYNCSGIGKGTSIAITNDYDNETRLNPPDIGADQASSSVTWTAGAGTSDWSTALNWNTGVVPIASTDVIIAAVLPSPVISTANADCRSLTINNLAFLTISTNKTLTVNATCASSTFTNNGAFIAGSGTEEVIFAGSSPNTITIGGTSSTTFNLLTLNVGALISTTPTISKQLQINTNSYVNLPVTYGSNSTLVYNPGGSYNVGNEWTGSTITAGYGTPNNVTIKNTSTVNLPSGTRGMAGNLNISSGTLNLNSSCCYDLYVGGNWTRDAIAGFFNHNCRAVFFTSTTTDQTITISNGGGTETFSYIIVDKSGKKLLLGTSTDVKINATAGCGLGNDYITISNGDIDLQGRTLTLQGPTGLAAGTVVMNLKVKNGTRSILSSVAGGVVSLTSTLNSKTVLIADGGGSGKISFGNNVEVRIASGEIDFGTGNLGTINYILRINSGGAVVGNAPYYADGSKLIFSNGTSYDIVSTQQVWETGTSALTPGVPYNVDVNLAGTDVRISDNLDRCVRNDFGIYAGTFELGAPGFMSGNLMIGGDWTRIASGTSFVPNTNKVTFNSTINAATQLQTITVSPSGNETFYDLELNNPLGLSLFGTPECYVTNHLYLLSGLLTTYSNEVYVTNTGTTAITYDPSNNSADSWINGYLRRKITTGNFDFPVGTSTTASAAGYELITFDFSSNSNVDNLRISFTSDGSTQNEPYFLQVNGTWVSDRLDAGWWTVRPYDAALSLVAAPNCSYDIFLNERGQTNSQANAEQYTVIKRDASYCYDVCATVWGQCGVHTNSTQWESGGTAHAERSGFSCNSFSDWAIGFAPVILPIELTEFNVVKEGADAVLSWVTATEINTDLFAVERSLDGISFSEIGRVKASGNSMIPNDYSFIDRSIDEIGGSILYYRLRMVDIDQSYEYSTVRVVEIGFSSITGIHIFPNPFTNEVTIVWPALSGASATAQIVDVTGRILIEKSVDLSEGANLIAFRDLSQLSNGVYLIRLLSGKQVWCEKLVKDQ